MHRGLLALGLALGMALLTACAVAPTQEMSDARVAMAAARDARAGRLAVVPLGEAERHLWTATESLRRGEFDRAREHARAATRKALEARDVARAVSEAVRAVAEAESRGANVAAARRLLDRARRAADAGDSARARDLARRAAAAL